jgi:L-ascorbate metabolism protein UlaG (beta-lactamase superfamily)
MYFFHQKDMTMEKIISFFLGVCVWTLQTVGAPIENPPDTIATKKGNLILHCIEHGSLMLEYRGLRIYVDPFARYADISKMPKADIILITHEHADHFDKAMIRHFTKNKTRIILNQSSYNILKTGTVMTNGTSITVNGILIEAVPAYNTTPGREMYHPKGRDNGYVLTAGGKRIYIAGDTEDIPEMRDRKNIDIAFLPMNLPYTMSPEQTAQAAMAFMPKILYPYHFGDTDVSKLLDLLKNVPDIEVRVKNMK